MMHVPFNGTAGQGQHHAHAGTRHSQQPALTRSPASTRWAWVADMGLTPAWERQALRSRVERELPLMRAVAARADIRVD